jgi:hypothetical protein
VSFSPLLLRFFFSSYRSGLIIFESYLTHYSYFGSFRSSVSNVGPNAAMLDNNGKLTKIGSWYLGNVPVGTSASAANSISVSAGWTLFVSLVCLLVMR